MTEDALSPEDCLNWDPDPRPGHECHGPVEYHWTGGTRSWPRCDKHQTERLESRENSMEIYADSDVVPDWFDPANAGEHWDDDY